MNAEPEEVAADLFLATLRIAFTGSAARAAIWIPQRPWVQTIGVPARRQLGAEGIEVSTGARVVGLRAADDGAFVRLGNGKERSVPSDGCSATQSPAP